MDFNNLGRYSSSLSEGITILILGMRQTVSKTKIISREIIRYLKNLRIFIWDLRLFYKKLVE
jgi:hypothetical protein